MDRLHQRAIPRSLHPGLEKHNVDHKEATIILLSFSLVSKCMLDDYTGLPNQDRTLTDIFSDVDLLVQLIT